jgi:parallel beta-helix repeat protein
MARQSGMWHLTGVPAKLAPRGSLLILVALLAIPAVFAEALCGQTLTQSVTLTKDLVANGTCFTVGADNIIIDGNGYNITGNWSGYGINNSDEYDNLVIKNFKGINNFAMGIYASRVVNSTIWNNTIINSNTGVYLYNSSSGNNVSGNTIANASIVGVSIGQASNSNTVSGNTIINSRWSVCLQTSSEENNMTGNTIINSSFYGVYMNFASHNLVAANTIVGSGYYGVYLYGRSNNNTIFANNISNSSSYDLYLWSADDNILRANLIANGSQTAIYLEGANSTTLDANIITKPVGVYDFSSTYYSNGTTFIDSRIGKYIFSSPSEGVAFVSSGNAKIRFLSPINDSGTNLSSDVQLASNFAYVNSSKTGLNKSANITFYNMPTDMVSPQIMRDNASCPAGVCYNFTSLNAGTVTFNATRWSSCRIVDAACLPPTNTDKLYVRSTATTGIPDLNTTQDGTENSIGLALATGGTYSFVNASQRNARGRLIRTIDVVNFSSYWTQGGSVNTAYATFELSYTSGGVTTVICADGNRNTGGHLLPAASTSALVVGNCTPPTDALIPDGANITYSIWVYASSIGTGNAASKTATLKWDTATANSWTNIPSVQRVQLDVTTNATSYLEADVVNASGALYWPNGTKLAGYNINLSFYAPDGSLQQQRTIVTGANGWYSDTFNLSGKYYNGSWSVNASVSYDACNKVSASRRFDDIVVQCPMVITGNVTLTRDLASNGTCFTIGADNIVIDGNGHSITGDGSGNGIDGSLGYDAITVKNFAGISTFTNGIYAASVANGTITNNTITNSNYGLYLVGFSSSNDTISGNTITNSNYGLYLDNAQYNTLSGNTIKNSSTGVDLFAAINNSITNNTIASRVYGVHLESASNNNNISGNTITNSSRGLYLNSASNSNTFISNAVTNSSYGLFLANSKYNTIRGTTITNSNLYGIYLYSANNNTISGGLVNLSGQHAIYLNGNSLQNNLTGITIASTNLPYKDLYVEAGANGTILQNMSIGEYQFNDSGGTATFVGPGVVQVVFLAPINGSGTNLSNDIQLAYNYAYVNSSKAGLNASANITLYGLPTDMANPQIMRDNASCPANTCRSLTGLNAGTVVFNVTGWSSYGVQDVPLPPRSEVFSTAKYYMRSNTASGTNATPALSPAQNGTTHYAQVSVGAGASLTPNVAAATLSPTNGFLIRSTDTINASTYWSMASGITSAYATYKFYYYTPSGGNVLLCQIGDDSTGGILLPGAGGMGLRYGACSPNSDVVVPPGASLIWNVDVYVDANIL